MIRQAVSSASVRPKTESMRGGDMNSLRHIERQCYVAAFCSVVVNAIVYTMSSSSIVLPILGILVSCVVHLALFYSIRTRDQRFIIPYYIHQIMILVMLLMFIFSTLSLVMFPLPKCEDVDYGPTQEPLTTEGLPTTLLDTTTSVQPKKTTEAAKTTTTTTRVVVLEFEEQNSRNTTTTTVSPTTTTVKQLLENLEAAARAARRKRETDPSVCEDASERATVWFYLLLYLFTFLALSANLYVVHRYRKTLILRQANIYLSEATAVYDNRGAAVTLDVPGLRDNLPPSAAGDAAPPAYPGTSSGSTGRSDAGLKPPSYQPFDDVPL